MTVRFARSEGVEMAPMREETVLFNPANNQFCVLNKTAAFVWEQLQVPCTAEQLRDALVSGFANAAETQVARDVDHVLASMQEAGCVTAIN